MLHFNELYITEDGKNLVIDAEIDNFEAYKDCYLERITVDTTQHCEEPGLFQEPLVVWEASLKGVGDLDGDGRFTEEDLTLWKQIMALSSLPKKNIHTREDGTRYYTKYHEDEEGNSTTIDVEVSDKLYEYYVYIASHYTDQFGGVGPENENIYLKTFSFLIDKFSDLSLYPILFGPENASDILDINGDNEINIADINKIIDVFLNQRLELYLERLNQDVIEEAPSTHKRLCLDSSLLVPLINMKDSLSDHIFVVKVEAVMIDKDGSIAKMGCGWDTATIYGAAYNSYPIYRGFLDMMDASGSGDICDNLDMENMSDYILNYYAFDFALRMGDWCTTWKYWNELKGSTTGAGVMIGGRCGCHGPY